MTNHHTMAAPPLTTYQIEHLHDSRRGDVIASCVIMIVVSTNAVILRFAVRKVKKIPFWWDDWLCVIALPWACSSAILALINRALGHHLWSLSLLDVERYLKILYAGGLTYGPGIVLVKLSILLFYRRVFPLEHVSRPWRISWWILLIFSTVMIVETIPGIFSCRPIRFFWDRTIPGGKCIAQVPFFRITSVINILDDIAILILPMFVLSKLQMGKSKKIGLVGLFLLGGL